MDSIKIELSETTTTDELLEEIKHHQDENPFIKIINETKRHIEQQNKEDFKQISKMVDETYYKEKNKQKI